MSSCLRSTGPDENLRLRMHVDHVSLEFLLIRAGSSGEVQKAKAQ